jgi:hypothetical protein
MLSGLQKFSDNLVSGSGQITCEAFYRDRYSGILWNTLGYSGIFWDILELK